MSKIRAVIIEDEIPAARLLNKMVGELRPNWEITVLPGMIEDAVEWFAVNPHPDIIFLDIQLNDGISFLFIEQAKPKSMIIFTTAYDEYAVRAFSVNSIDYLLKPIHKERLNDAIEKFERFYMADNGVKYHYEGIEQLLKTFTDKQEKQYRTRFLISSPKRFYTIMVSDIAYFYSEDKTTFAITNDRKRHLIDYPLTKLEEQLDPKQFMRVNRQFILSAGCIRNVQNYFNGKMTVSVSSKFEGSIHISREKVPVIKMWLAEEISKTLFTLKNKDFLVCLHK